MQRFIYVDDFWLVCKKFVKSTTKRARDLLTNCNGNSEIQKPTVISKIGKKFVRNTQK